MEQKIQLLHREILANKPRVTRYNIDWDVKQQATVPTGFADPAQAGATMGGMVGMVEQPSNPMKVGSYGDIQGIDSGVAPMES